MPASAPARIHHVAPAVPAEPPPPVRVNWPALGVLLAIAVQSAAAIWWASGMDRRMSSMEASVPAGALARIDERTAGMRDSLDRIDRRLDKLEDRR